MQKSFLECACKTPRHKRTPRDKRAEPEKNTPPQAYDFAKVRFESASSGFPTPMISQNGGTCARFLKKSANCAQGLQKNTCDAFLDLVTSCARVLSSKKPPMTESPGVKARGQTKTRLPNTRFRENARFFARFLAIFRDFFAIFRDFFAVFACFFCGFCENLRFLRDSARFFRFFMICCEFS